LLKVEKKNIRDTKIISVKEGAKINGRNLTVEKRRIFKEF